MNEQAPPILTLDNISMSYGNAEQENRIFEDLSLQVHEGEFVSLVGPSGVGKTTLLRCLSGLQLPRTGRVLVRDEPISAPHPEMTLVFQDYSRSLLPWMTSGENVAFPLQGRGVGRAERRKRADESLAKVGLAGQGAKYPWEMSGGMQQRVAIARALAYNANVLLMDEPFASVDAQTRFDLEDLLIKLRAELGVTIVLVTHDVDEALYLADKVVVLAGKPAGVVEIITTGFGIERDQIATKSLPAFSENRARILAHLRSGPESREPVSMVSR